MTKSGRPRDVIGRTGSSGRFIVRSESRTLNALFKSVVTKGNATTGAQFDENVRGGRVKKT